ncbi:MAG: helix-turn-helix domain-containing protein [Parvularculaceae bacterium]
MPQDQDAQTGISADRLAPPAERCGLAAAIELIGDRWTLLIIRSALYGVTRFDDLHAALGAPRTVLSNRLKGLVDNGVMKRRAYKEQGQRTRHQYVLTQKGVDLALPLMALMQWGQKHVLAEAAAPGIVSRRTGQPLHLGLVDNSGSTAPLAEVQFKPAA